jgi:hypothetical protein
VAFIGYAFLQELPDISAFAPRKPALVKPVTRVEATPTWLAVPKHVAPTSDSPLEHVLFALKHEGVNLQILAQVLPRIAAEDLVAAIRSAPGAIYLRKACYLWELFSERRLEDLPAITGAPALLFDPKRYVTGPTVRASRWRVAFNGLGSPHYCATVERTAGIEAALASDILGRVTAFLDGLAPGMLDRTLAWAYLHETQESFAIERESPSEDKAHAFVRLLKQAHERRALSEDYLAELQAATISNPFLKAFAFRTEQNWLGGSGSGATGVTYIPPPPELARELMSELMAFANASARQVNALVAATVISFGFVFIHPFMDGNGRLSRFLFHQTLCQSGRLADGLVLPISIAMRKHEADYMRALQDFSARARRSWRVTWFDAERFDFKFLGHDSIYRYWDATSAVEFGLAMAREALELELMNETRFIARFDAIARAVNDRFDVRGSDLSQLIVACLQNHNVISKRRKDQFALAVPQPVFDLIESLAHAIAADEAAKEASATAIE